MKLDFVLKVEWITNLIWFNMAKHFIWQFLYWARTGGKRSYGYILNKRDYHHALERYKMKQLLKTEKDEVEGRHF